MSTEKFPEVSENVLDWTIDVFKPCDAAGTVELYREIYGDKFPFKPVYDPEFHVKQAETQDTCRAVARLSNGRIVGTVAMFRSVHTNKDLYEMGGMLVSSDYRKQNVAQPLVKFAANQLMTIFDLKNFFAENVCNHIVTQNAGIKNGYIPGAIEVDMMPEDAYRKLEDRGLMTNSRISNVVQFKIFTSDPRDIFIPSFYEDVLRRIYSFFNFEHRLHSAKAESGPASGETSCISEEYKDASFARLTVRHIGADFPAWIDGRSSDLRKNGIGISEIIIPLDTPAVEIAVQELLRNGYWLGGLMPKWFGADGFMMQRTDHRPDFDKMKIYSKQAKDIFAMVRADFERAWNAKG